MSTRRATIEDAAAIAAIYNEGIEDRVATFETDLRSEDDVRAWFARSHPIVVVERDSAIVAFASSSSSSGRCCYAGNLDFSVYVARSARGQGVGKQAMQALIEAAKVSGCTKLISGVFPENAPSRKLLQTLGFREVGTQERHGKLDGRWRDVIVVERVLSYLER